MNAVLENFSEHHVQICKNTTINFHRYFCEGTVFQKQITENCKKFFVCCLENARNFYNTHLKLFKNSLHAVVPTEFSKYFFNF